MIYIVNDFTNTYFFHRTRCDLFINKFTPKMVKFIPLVVFSFYNTLARFIFSFGTHDNFLASFLVLRYFVSSSIWLKSSTMHITHVFFPMSIQMFSTFSLPFSFVGRKDAPSIEATCTTNKNMLPEKLLETM